MSLVAYNKKTGGAITLNTNGNRSNEFDDILGDILGDNSSEQELADDNSSEQELSHGAHESEVVKVKVAPLFGAPLFGAQEESQVKTDEEIIEQHEDSSELEVDKESTGELEDIESVVHVDYDVEIEDDFDSMLDEIIDNETIEEPEFKLALEVEGMSEVKVTPDGRTLDEMLAGIRKGPKKSTDYINELKEKAGIVKVGDKTFTDGRYSKAAENAEAKKEYNHERKKLSNRFLQKYARFTEQEKIIADNLGVQNADFVKLMKKGVLSDKEKERVLAAGRRGPELHFKGRRYRATIGDKTFVEFLSKFKYANTRVLRWISDEPQGRAWRKLRRLKENGLVSDTSIIGIADMWKVTAAGAEMAGLGLKPGFTRKPKMMTIAPTLGVNYLAACLWFNTVNVLNLDDFPAHNRIIPKQEDGRDRVRGEMLISEYELRSSLGKEINPQSTIQKNKGNRKLYDVVSENVRKQFDLWELNGRQGESPEMLRGNEYMWILYPRSSMTGEYHVPDLVVKRERGKNGEPRSIAVELERSSKANAQYKKIMLSYKLDTHLYEKVIWVTPNARVAEQLKKAAAEVGFDRFDIVPIITKDGTYNNPDMWMI